MKYITNQAVIARNKPQLPAWPMGWINSGFEFDDIESVSNWISYKKNRWIPSYACNLVDYCSPPVISSNDMFLVPATGEYYQLLHDWQKGRRRVGRLAMPETVATTKQEFCPLDKSWQYFWFELLQLSNQLMTEQEIMIAWASLTYDKRAFTDRHAVQNGFADYVQDLNIDKKPISIKELSCAGNIVKAVGKDKKSIIVECFNGSKPAPNAADVWGVSPEKIHWATEISTIVYKKRWASDKFPQLKGCGVPFPLLTMTGTTRFSINDVVKIPNGKLYSPYAISK
jgi:hypothetical protein